jgi:hypothetical protein
MGVTGSDGTVRTYERESERRVETLHNEEIRTLYI